MGAGKSGLKQIREWPVAIFSITRQSNAKAFHANGLLNVKGSREDVLRHSSLASLHYININSTGRLGPCPGSATHQELLPVSESLEDS
jgi:hypothetical protein